MREEARGKPRAVSVHSAPGKRSKRLLKLVAAESRLAVLRRIGGQPHDPDNIYQEEGGSG